MNYQTKLENIIRKTRVRIPDKRAYKRRKAKNLTGGKNP